MRVSRGMQSLGSGFPIGARSIPVGTRFCLQSLVCYTFCDRRISQKCTGKGLSHARQTLFGGSRTGGFCGQKGTQNEGFSMSKIRLFVCSWHRKSCSEAERFSVPTGAQEVYKNRLSVRLSCQLNHHGSSSHTLSNASFSVDFALLSDKKKCSAVSVKGCSISSSNPKRYNRYSRSRLLIASRAA